MSEAIEFGEATVDDAPVEEKAAPLAVDEIVEVKPADELAEKVADEDLSPEAERDLIDTYYPLPEDFPSEEQIKAWEAEFGRLRVHRIAPNEAYVIRALSRSELRKYLAIIKAKFAGKEADEAEERMVSEELLVERCCLYPVVNAKQIRGESTPLHKVGLAGTVSILAFDIQEISNLIESNVGPFEEV